MNLKPKKEHLIIKRRQEPVLGEYLDDYIVVESADEEYKKGDIVVIEEGEPITKVGDVYIVSSFSIIGYYE